MTQSVGKVYEVIKEQKARVLENLKTIDAKRYFYSLTHPDGLEEQYKQRAYAYEIADNVLDAIIERMESEGI